MNEKVYDYLCSIGELVDKLSIENIKCHYANMRILDERQKLVPNNTLISELEAKARAAGEQRVRLRDEINRRLKEALERGSIECASEVRTYSTEKK